MKLAEALKIVQAARDSKAEKIEVYLACGFLPLHLATFLEANLRQLFPERRIEIQVGLYGDMAGNLDRLRKAEASVGVAVFEWADFDPRLGLRSLGGWQPAVLEDIVTDAQLKAEQFLESIVAAAQTKVIAVSLPTLPLPPISYQPPEQASECELRLTELVSKFEVKLASAANVKLLNQRRLDLLSPLNQRLDVKSELSAGFPYQLAHASILAEMLAPLVYPRVPKKGLITDLDDTFWRGLLGEDGIAGVSWHLDQQSHSHALYQQLLQALAESGVLLAVASKNDEALALKAFERDDLLVGREHFFPLEINWRAKSESVARILEAWNIAADSVVFVDDSALELAEVKAAFPEMACLLFPTRDDQAVHEVLVNLRGLFGRDAVNADDAIRLDSLRDSVEFRASVKTNTDDFLAAVAAELTLDINPDQDDSRALELMNKTNQFNLNGKRLTQVEFAAQRKRPDAFMLVTSYKDKYGPLGKISVMLGTITANTIKIDNWVMSCRAFSRRIEHACLDYLFEKFGASEIIFDYQPTERNLPLKDFLTDLLSAAPQPGSVLEKTGFVNKRPRLHHTIRELAHA